MPHLREPVDPTYLPTLRARVLEAEVGLPDVFDDVLLVNTTDG
jgi:hypothetical protein